MFTVTVETETGGPKCIALPFSVTRTTTAMNRGREALDKLLAETGDADGCASVYDGIELIASFVAASGVIEQETI